MSKMMSDSTEQRLPLTIPTTRRGGAEKSDRRQRMIVAPKHDTKYADREVDWQETMKPSFQAIVDCIGYCEGKLCVRCAV